MYFKNDEASLIALAQDMTLDDRVAFDAYFMAIFEQTIESEA